MEAVIFSLLVAALVMRQTTADIPYAIRGKTPPAHQRRMAAMANREAAAQRRHERSVRRHNTRERRATVRERRRNTPFRRYVRGVWDHAWEQAATRRVVRWQEKNPVKAERYRERLRARQRGDTSRRRLRDWFLTRVHRARSFNTSTQDSPANAATGTAASSSDTGRGAETGSDDADEDIVDAEVVENPPDVSGAPTNYATEDTAHDDATSGQQDIARESEEDTQDDRRDTATQQPNREKEEPAMSPTGEITGLSDAMALTQSWETETKQAVASLEAAIASMQSAEVGAQVTGAFQQAMEAMNTAHEAFVQAHHGLQQSVNVGEAYQAAPQAGNRQFVTS